MVLLTGSLLVVFSWRQHARALTIMTRKLWLTPPAARSSAVRRVQIVDPTQLRELPATDDRHCITLPMPPMTTAGSGAEIERHSAGAELAKFVRRTDEDHIHQSDDAAAHMVRRPECDQSFCGHRR